MAIKTSDLNAKLFGKADKRRATTHQEAQTAAKDKANIIELAIAGESLVTFKLVKVAAQEIATVTRVFDQNAREQSFLNEHALSDILLTLKERGQQYPAVGRIGEDGVIEVLDGSRRRMACLIAQQDFLIYVAEGINSEHAKFLSDVANAHKPLSLYEKGREMQAKLDAREAEDQKALAKMFQCSEALVSGALKAADLPLELLQAYPNVVELGRPTIVKLHKQYHSLTDKDKQLLLDKCNRNDSFVWQRCSSQGVARITKEVTETIESWIEDFKPKTMPESNKVDLIRGRATYVRKGSNVSINLKRIDDDLLQELSDFLIEKLK
ncbi:ParB/RepB/Spo0J family partition protein [Vibrio sp.]|uniref:ParB/RepB/Spo0J family partition protein n=1 Tax=Vibrio viridaestus TaxID=2487322 RepID=A0A3N9U9T7_9VIBR|nr:ParB/RepB/Spo0J family partition protein [Vibrio viridaestus]MDC0611982.1 ParB/RepB/Spo0J family partition protein [Vibrio sp.]RQW65036.1 ParB/RepB/Spo0J family partition protein [Vibrio viridaestus]